MLHKTFPTILEGHEASHIQACDYARGMDWSVLETDVQNIKAWHYDHINTVNGVGVYYNFCADHYFFTDEVED